MHERFGAGEFADALPASAAWRHEFLARADHDDMADATFARHDHRGNRARLGAASLRVGGVLDIASGMNQSGFGDDRGADGEV
mgnify:CR=1 FL=1